MNKRELEVSSADLRNAPAFSLTGAQLATLVAGAVEQALDTHAGGPLLVDKQAMAQRLGCSATHIDTLRKRGLPVVPVGELVRFDPRAVLEWLKARP